ncbi:hypothetical protein J3R83DRAFT_13558 [Lanmaoa asiatica]|nr:hypothetical protein J3R83DRAFT_13558 [Lanmaoa asiatica]
MSSSSNAPKEPAHIILDEVAWLQGAFLSSLLCGVQITLSAMSFLAVLKQRMRRRLRIALLVYTFLLCATMTAGQLASLQFVQMGFIESRDYPGGPNSFLSGRYAAPVDMASTSLFVFANWMMESLLVWRCKVVCSTGERPVWIGVIIPSVLLVSEYGASWSPSWSLRTNACPLTFSWDAVTGSLFLHRMLQGGYVINYALAYSSLSLLLNVTVTGIIAGRLLLHRRRMVRQFGPGHGSHYASVATILIESASFYTGFLILVIIFFCVASSASNLLQQMVAHVESITSLLIIYRIAQGKGWNDNVGVSSDEWRGEMEPRVEPEVVDLEIMRVPARGSMHPLSVLSKEEETQTPMSVSSVDATLDDAL